MIRNHLLGLPFIFGMERVSTVTAMADAKTPSQIAAELEEQRRQAQAADAKAYEGMKAPPKAVKQREQPYSPEGFDFQYVDRKGHQGEVIKGRLEPAKADWPFPDPVESQPITPLISEQTHGATHRYIGPGIPLLYRVRNGTVECATTQAPDYWQPSLVYQRPADLARADVFEVLAPIEWQSGPPPSVGWWDTKDAEERIWPIEARYWDGYAWSKAPSVSTSTQRKLYCASQRTGSQILGWRGPRLTGADWPDPAAA